MSKIVMPTVHENEIYAGIITWNDGNPKHHLILILDDSPINLHAHQADWAFKAGGDLPMRNEMWLLHTNCKSFFDQRSHYWTGERNVRFSRFFWLHSFGSGLQTMCDGLTVEGRAVAVRRVAINNTGKWPSILGFLRAA
jgi:hypothetical protein